MDTSLIYGYITDQWIYYWSMDILPINGYITDLWIYFRSMDILLIYGYITDQWIYYRSMNILPINGYKIFRRIVQLPVRSWRKPVPRFISKFGKRVSRNEEFWPQNCENFIQGNEKCFTNFKYLQNIIFGVE